MTTELDLSGDWEILFDFLDPRELPADVAHADGWQSIVVPGCWEQIVADKRADGPVWYRKRFDVPAAWSGQRMRLDCDGINYYSEIWLNGQRVGEHTGGWAGFTILLRDILHCGAGNELLVKVYKQGNKFPLRESLAGFLPDVNVMFGGIWKGMWLRQASTVGIEDVFVKPRIAKNAADIAYTLRSLDDATVSVHVSCSVIDVHGRVVAQSDADRMLDNSSPVEFATTLPFTDTATPWTPEHPTLYDVHVRCSVEGTIVSEQRSRFGMRETAIVGSQLLLNDESVYLRGVLHWGWYRDEVAPIPTRQQIRDELLKVKENGFNLVKLCLFVPTQDYFDLADEIGILLWQELPMWLPVVSDPFKQTVFAQYADIIREVRRHPSVILWTLGCELDQSADAEFLGQLYDMTKHLTDGAVLRDNSGSGECYGGILNEHADFYDYHFYTDVHFFHDLMAQFAAPWRPIKPWLFGEFCDYDTFRDVGRLRDEHDGALPWWLQDDAMVNPASQKRTSRYAHQEQALATFNLPFTSAALCENSNRSAYAYRKLVLELVRTYPQVGGYVITSIWDTPLATSSIFNDFNQPKHPPNRLRMINADTVLALTWDHRRAWVFGGDRVVHWDHYNYLSGDWIRPHLFVSHYGRHDLVDQTLRWQVSVDGVTENVLVDGCVKVSMRSGEAREVEVLEFPAPVVDVATKLRLSLDLTASGEGVENHWELWILPQPTWTEVMLYDPRGLLSGLEKHCPSVQRLHDSTEIAGQAIIVATDWNPLFNTFLQQGGNVFYIQRGEGQFAIARVPFWRESLQLFYDHALTAQLPHEHHTGTFFHSLATDSAFTVGDLPPHTPLLGRLDARLFDLHQYMMEMTVGQGRLIATTLRVEGGLGSQPSDIAHSPAGLHLLDAVIRYCAAGRGAGGAVLN